MLDKKGQVTIFIIVAIVIISIIGLFFLLRSGVVPEVGIGKETSPPSFLESCIEDKIKEAVEIISLQGGSVNPALYKTFKFTEEEVYRNISYLCYTQNYYISCINQEPMIIQHLKNEIHNYISDDVYDCFNNKLTKSLDKQGYTVVADYEGFEVKLMEKKVVIEIDAELTLTKAGETSKQEDFKIIIPSRFYDLAIVVQEIVSQEARYCNFEYVGYMAFYPQWDIDKFRTSDSIIIYTVEHRDSKEKFRFAVRGCVMPPGFG